MNNKYHKKVLFSLLLLSSLYMLGQETGKVTGKVFLSGNTPEENISVIITSETFLIITY
ncbi:hypothetical protein [Flavobacterium piscis]|uniref:DUF4369 domain-containing protein n=1 Tax=Flavobacterium piscis TaxID=1114874 RepID=A0ABU1YEC7_9FLAO|nr:hypothetical protein [Flavobacterium piscis]MDR7212597.1 hypothetical protein [Flavobacterium piscis]